MAFPVVVSVTPSVQTANSTQHLVTMPATVDAGDLLVAILSFDGTPTVTTPTDWNLVELANSSQPTVGVYYKVAVGDEDGTNVDFVSDVAEKSAHHVYHITGYDAAPVVGTSTTGTSELPDPPSLSPSWGAADTLWIAISGLRGAAGSWAVDLYPTDYTNGVANNAGGAGQAGLGTARRERNASSEDPGSFDWNVSTNWRAQTLAVRPAGLAAPTGLTAVAVSPTRIDVAWDPVDGATHYDVERDSVVIATRITATTYQDEGLNAGTKHDYRVLAARLV